MWVGRDSFWHNPSRRSMRSEAIRSADISRQTSWKKQSLRSLLEGRYQEQEHLCTRRTARSWLHSAPARPNEWELSSSLELGDFRLWSLPSTDVQYCVMKMPRL